MNVHHLQKQPLFNIPAATKWLAVILVAIAVIRLVLPADLERTLLGRSLFFPYVFGGPFSGYWTILTYGFFHHGFMHLAINTGMIIAMGSLLERITGAAGFVLTFGLGCMGGALAYYLTAPEATSPLIGASGGLTALLGAAAIVMRHTLRNDPRSRMLMILVAIGIVLDLYNAIFGSGGIAWQAHFGGLITGLLIGFGMTRMMGPRRN